MTAATVDLYEDVRLSSDVEVDEAAGVLRNVKIIGLKSANGRRYDPAAIAAARDQYEGRKSYTDHATKAGERSVRDTFGWFENVKPGPDGARGDYHVLNPKEDLAVRLFAAAKKNPSLYGFSHHAKGRVKRVNGEDVVESIEEVYSVDLVDRPATTKGLRESRQPMKLRDYYRAIADGIIEARHAPLKGLLVKLLEMDMAGVPDATMPDDAPAATDPDEAIKAGFKAAIHAVVDDDSMDMQAKLSKIKEILKAQEKLMGAGKDAEKPAEGDGAASEGAKPPAGNLTEAQLRAELDMRDLIEESGLKFTKPEHRRAFVKALVPLTEAERKTLVEAARAGATAARPATPPRSGPATPLTESAKKCPDLNDIEAIGKWVHS
jgi:hypothetical protein